MLYNIVAMSPAEIGCISIFIHFIFTAFMLIAPFCIKNIDVLMILIFLNACLITEWYVLGGSVLNQYDHYAYDIVFANKPEQKRLNNYQDNTASCYENYKYHTGIPASLPIIYMHKRTGIEIEMLGKISACIPLAYIGYMLMKIHRQIL